VSRAQPQRRGAPVVERVLTVTLEALARVGYERLSVPEVAAAAGLNKTSVYRRWPTKAALVQAALARGLGHDAPLREAGELRADLRHFVRRAGEWAQSPVGRGVAEALRGAFDDPELKVAIGGLMRARSRGPLTLLRRAQRRGDLNPRADLTMALTVMAGALSQRINVERAPVTPTFVRRLVDLVVDGLAKA